MKITSLFSGMARKLALRPKNAAPAPAQKPAHPQPVDSTPDALISKIIDLLQEQGFTFSKGRLAERAFASHIAMKTGKPVAVSGIDFFKSKDNDELNIVSLVCKSQDKKIHGPFNAISFNDASSHFVVQFDVDPKKFVNVSTLKYVPLQDFAAQIKDPNFNIAAFFETLQRPPLRKPPSQAQKNSAG